MNAEEILTGQFIVGFSVGVVVGILLTLLVEGLIFYYLKRQDRPLKEIESREESLIRFLAVLATIALVAYFLTSQGQELNEVLVGGLIAIIGAGVLDKKVSLKGKG